MRVKVGGTRRGAFNAAFRLCRRSCAWAWQRKGGIRNFFPETHLSFNYLLLIEGAVIGAEQGLLQAEVQHRSFATIQRLSG